MKGNKILKSENSIKQVSIQQGLIYFPALHIIPRYFIVFT